MLHVFVVIGIVACLVGISGIRYIQWRLDHGLDRIPKIALPDETLDAGPHIPGTGPTPAYAIIPANTPALGGDRAYNVLMVGLDTRSEELCASGATSLGCGEVGGSRTDTIMLARIDPTTYQAAVLSIPRDLYLKIAGTSRKDKVNAAYAIGAGTLVQTLQENLNVPVNHYVEIDFVGFSKLVDAVGGVELCFDFATRDEFSGLNQQRGCRTVGSEQAIAYVRSRQYKQELSPGTWTLDHLGDLGRIKRQQFFLIAAMKKAGAKAGNPLGLSSMLNAVKDAVKIDEEFSFDDFTGLANQFREFDPAQVEFSVIPGTPQRIGDQDVIVIDPIKGGEVVGRFGTRR